MFHHKFFLFFKLIFKPTCLNKDDVLFLKIKIKVLVNYLNLDDLISIIFWF